MAVGTPKYLSATTAKANSIVDVVRNAQDTTLSAFILRAEDLIDAYVGPRPHHADDTDTHRVFPRAQDENASGTPTVPVAVATATLYTIEWLMLRGAPAAPDAFDASRQSESLSSSGGYSYAALKAQEEAQKILPPLVRQLLAPFLPVAVASSVRHGFE